MLIKIFDLPLEIIKDNERQRRVYDIKGGSPTILSRTDSAKVLKQGVDNMGLRIRKLTEDECFVLMG